MKIRLIKPGFFSGLMCAVICVIGAPGVAAAACATPDGPPIAVDKISGIRTKWLSYARDRRNSIQPDFAHLPLKDWVRNLEAVGVNIAEINLEPQRKLARAPRLSPEALKETIDAIYTPENVAQDNWGAYMDADRSRASARRLLELAAAERAFLIYGHDPAQWATLRKAPAYYD